MNRTIKSKNIKKNFILNFIRTLITGITPLIIFPYASRILGVNGIGRVEFSQSIASYFQLFALLGIQSYAIREGGKCEKDTERLGRLASELILLNVVATVVSVSIYGIVIFQIPILKEYRTLLVIFSLYIIFAGINLDWIYNVLEEYFYITIRSIAAQVISVAGLLLFVRTPEDICKYAMVLVIPYGVEWFCNVSYLRKQVPLFKHNKISFWQHGKPVLLVFAIILSSSIYSLLDSTMLGLLMGDRGVGLYTAASKLCRMVVKLISALRLVFLSRLTMYYFSGKKKEYETLLVQSGNVIMLLAIPVAAGMFCLSKECILLFSGKAFLEASVTMKILTVDMVLSVLSGYFGWQVLMPIGKETYLLRAVVCGAVSDFVLNLILIPLYGVNGAAAATVISEAIVLSVCIFHCRKLVNLKKVFEQSKYYVIGTIPIVVVCYVGEKFISNALLCAVVCAAAGAAAYFGFLFSIGKIKISGDKI